MAHFTNLIPVIFQNNKIKLRFWGYESQTPEDTLAFHIFEHQGQWFSFPHENDDPSAEYNHENPNDHYGQLHPFILKRLALFLNSKGDLTQDGDNLKWIPSTETKAEILHPANNYQFSIELSPDQTSFLLRISHTGGNTNIQDILRTQSFLDYLSESKYFSTDLTLAPWAPSTTSTMPSPTLLFDPDGTKHGQDPKVELLRHGPYSAQRLASTALRVLVISTATHQAPMGKLVAELKNGLGGIYEATQTWKLPWHSAFRFAGCDFVPLNLQNAQPDTHLPRLNEELDKARAAGRPYNLALVENIPEQSNFYPLLAAQLLQTGIPYHPINPENATLPSLDRANFLLNTATMLYAKAGGEPWLLPQESHMEHELVIGVGTEPSENRILGHVTIFSHHGNYKLGNTSWAASESEWLEQMTTFVTNQIAIVRRKSGWADRDRVRVVFHLDRCLPQAQLQTLDLSVRQAISAPSNPADPACDIETTYLYFAYDHEYRLWDQDRPTGTFKPSPKNHYPPQRGIYKVITPTKVLIQLAEPEEIAQHPYPLLMHLISPNEREDIDYLARQAYHFCHLSWASVKPKLLPVTLEYGQKVAAAWKMLYKVDPTLSIPESLHSIPWYL